MEVILSDIQGRLEPFSSLEILALGAATGIAVLLVVWLIVTILRGNRLREMEETLDALEDQLRETEQENARLGQQVKMTEERLAEVKDLRASMASTFGDLSNQTLKSTVDQFLKIANQRFDQLRDGAKGDLDQRAQSISQMIKPLGEGLKKIDDQVRDLEKQREGAYQSLRQQVGTLSQGQEKLTTVTGNLAKALGTTNVRGRWGELQLKRAVELAGMVEYCDFEQQRQVATEGGTLRPDMIVRLPGGGQIVVDAKTPLDAYMAAMEADSDELRGAAMAQHAARVAEHVKELSRKGYRDQFDPTPDFVVMFLPTESIFAAALDARPELIEAGARDSVILATPTTLIALLRAVAYGWRQERLAQNARLIADTGRDLYERLTKLGDHTQKLGTQLGRSVQTYNEMVGTLESRVLVSARKMSEMGVPMGEKPIPAIRPVEESPRPVSKPELLVVGDGDP
ncbi:MAG: DNA recombination protein RmuC [Pseudomonadota bacterium]